MLDLSVSYGSIGLSNPFCVPVNGRVVVTDSTVVFGFRCEGDCGHKMRGKVSCGCVAVSCWIGYNGDLLSSLQWKKKRMRR